MSSSSGTAILQIGWLIFASCVLAFGVFVWPTPYEYVHPARAPFTVRVQRATGATSVEYWKFPEKKP